MLSFKYLLPKNNNYSLIIIFNIF